MPENGPAYTRRRGIQALGVGVSIKLASCRDVSEGTHPGQFAIGDRSTIASLSDLDPSFKKLMDEPVTQVLGIVGPGGRANLTPMWFDYEGDSILINGAAPRTKTEWIRQSPRLTSLLVNPANPYHWLSIKHTVTREVSEDDPVEGQGVPDPPARLWTRRRHS